MSMDWLTEEEQEEWAQDPLVDKLAAHLRRKREEAVVRLRTQARQGSLEDVRRAMQRVDDMEDVLKTIGADADE